MKKLFIAFLALQFLSACSLEESWSKERRESFINSCVARMGIHPDAKEICTCVEQKKEKQFPDYAEFRHLDIDPSQSQFVKECIDSSNLASGTITK